jgi:hypothetical protein
MYFVDGVNAIKVVNSSKFTAGQRRLKNIHLAELLVLAICRLRTFFFIVLIFFITVCHFSG